MACLEDFSGTIKIVRRQTLELNQASIEGYKWGTRSTPKIEYGPGRRLVLRALRRPLGLGLVPLSVNHTAGRHAPLMHGLCMSHQVM
jgi:hypothetical protein